MAISLNEIKKELVNLLRNSDVISIGNRGVTTAQDTGTFTADIAYTVATNPTQLKNIRSIIIASIGLEYGTDYTFDFETGEITFTVAQTGGYEIDYDYGTTDRIFPDYPQANLKLNQFPRIAVDIISSVSNEFGIGAELTQSTYTVSVVAYGKSQYEVEDMISSIKTTLMDNKKELYYSAFITPTDTGPLLISEFGDNKVFQRNQDSQVRFSFDARTPSTPPTPPNTLINGLQAYYTLNATGTTTILSSTGSNNATANTTLILDGSAGQINACGHFGQATTHKISIPTMDIQTIAFWTKVTTNGNYFFDGRPNFFPSYVNGAEFGTFWTSWIDLVPKTSGQWGTYWSVGGNMNVWTFVILEGSSVQSFSSGTLGNSGTSATESLFGFIDEIGIWNRTLTPAEKLDLYNGGVGKTYPFA